MRRLAVVLAGVLLTGGGRAAAEDPAPQPSALQAFTAHDHLVGARLSPNGRFRGEIVAFRGDGRGAGRLVFGYRAGEMQVGSHIRRAEAERAWGRVLARFRADSRKVLVQAER